jgi:nucleoid-associated protein YgaU
MILTRSISPFERYGSFVPESDAFLTTHLYVSGETLTGLAHRYYDDWRLWRTIADRNIIRDPRRITPGTLLVIPAQPIETGSFESF